MVVLAALSLSLSSFLFPAFVSLLTMASGLIALMARRCMGFAGLALGVNFLPLAGIFEPGISQDWLVTQLDISPFILTILLMVMQVIFLGVVIWKWAFSLEPYCVRNDL